MPKELQRVMKRNSELQQAAAPLLIALRSPADVYLQLSANLQVQLDELAERLQELGAQKVTDPRAAQDPAVADMVEQAQKSWILMTDNKAAFTKVARHVNAVVVEVQKLEKDVAAVIKAKSGFFSTSKSLPDLKKLATTLHTFGEDLKAAASAI